MLSGPDLNSRQKAAIIVRLMLADGEGISLQSMPPDAQAALAHEMAMMGMVDRDTRDRVVREFCDSLDRVGLTFPCGMDGTLDILEPTLSRDTTDRLRRMAAMAGAADPWDRIATMTPRQLCELAMAEAIEVAAVMFSKLPVPKAAETFGLMPADHARQIAYAMSMTGGIEAPALRRIGLALLHAAEGLARPAIDGGPVEKVGAILNFTPAMTRDEVLQGLDQDDADFANEVRKSIFTWANIPRRIDPRDVPRIIREVDGLALARAIGGARDKNKPSAEFILSSLSQRMADSLREEVEGLGRVSAAEAEEAMNTVVAAIRRMEDAGELFLIAAEIVDDRDPDEIEMKVAGEEG